MTIRLTALILVAACARSPRADEARIQYNAALSLAADGDHEAAVRGLIEARAGAGADAELRFSAAFALGESYAAWAEQPEGEGGQLDPEVAAERLMAARSWFADAARLRPEDGDVRANLDVVNRRLADLQDRLTSGERALSARLDRALEDQRRIRDQLHRAEAALAAAAATEAQLAPALDELAVAERALLADIGVVVDLAGDERAGIEAIPEAERTPEQGGRLVQLAALTRYLEEARSAGAQVRRSARKRLASRAGRRAEDAVAALVRAREQLLDPAAALRDLAADQAPLLQSTAIALRLGSGEISLSTGEGDEEAGEPPPIPPHLAPERLGTRQAGLGERGGELAARLAAFAAAPAAAEADAAEVRQVIESARPFVSGAAAAMKAAAGALEGGELDFAVDHQSEALSNLARALEYFANLRQLIEITDAGHREATALLDPDAPGAAAERRRRFAELTTLGGERIERLSLLLERERAAAETALESQGEGGDAEADAEALRASRAAIAARFEKAEKHRGAAAIALAAMASAPSPARAREHARAASAEIGELRRIFFTIVERLEELRRLQSATRDGTASLHSASDEERAPALGAQAASQAEHARTGAGLGEALAAQADQAAAAPAQPGGAGGDADRLAAAADEVRQGTARMEAAATRLGEAAAATAMSVDLEPPLADQAAAIEHITRAIELLKPPEEQPPEDQEQKEQEQNKDEGEQGDEPPKPEPGKGQPPPRPDEKLSQAEVDRRLRAIREREDERRRDRRRQRGSDVEKDW